MKYLFAIFLMLTAFVTKAQEQLPMADAMRENGKIYVVVAVLTVILLGMIIYLISIDRKLRKLEKEIK